MRQSIQAAAASRRPESLGERARVRKPGVKPINVTQEPVIPVSPALDFSQGGREGKKKETWFSWEVVG